MQKTSAWFVFAALLCSREAMACAPAPRAGDRVDVAEESAVIVWEPETKTQHFIRRATFRGEAGDFGFLVPTPSRPELAGVDDEVFSRLQHKTMRQTEHRTVRRIDWTPLLLRPFIPHDKGETAGSARAPVEVLATQKVAGYEAAILDATDAGALDTWLAANGYDTSPDLAEWLKAYIDRRWIVTAFKIDKGAGAMARTEAVRMSFTTERPFFPYREPASQREGASAPRVLAIWFIGPERVTGRIGGQTPWPGQLFWSDRIGDTAAGGVTLAPRARLTAFQDHSSPRPGTDDLYFERDPDQQTVLPPPNVETEYRTTWVPLDAMLAPLALGGWWWRRMKKRAASGRRTAGP